MLWSEPNTKERLKEPHPAAALEAVRCTVTALLPMRPRKEVGCRGRGGRASWGMCGGVHGVHGAG